MRRQLILISVTAIMVVLGLCGSTLIADVSEGIISHWRFDEGEGTIAYDSAGTNDGTVYGAIWTTGQINGALSFDGVDDYVDVGDPMDESLDFGASDSFSISAWIRTNMDSPIVYKRICGGIGGVYDEGYNFHLLAEKLYFAIEDNSGRNAGVFGNTMVADDQWHHVVAVRDTGEDKLYLYADGSSDATPVIDATTVTLATIRSFHIGRRDATVSPGYVYFEGTMDDVRIYDRPLSAAEIMELYSLSDSGPIAHWKFDEGSGSIAYDSAGTNDGAICGAAWTTGHVAGALSFDGLDDYVFVPDDYSLDLGTHDLSFAFWFKTGDSSIEQMLTKRSTTTGPSNRVWDGYSSALLEDGTVNVHFRHSASSDSDVIVTSTATYNDGNWHHLAGVYTRSANLEMYIDGVPEGTPKDISYAENKDINLTQPLAIGCRVVYGRSNDLYFNGTIDDVRVYDRPLSAEEIWDIYMFYPAELRNIDIKPASCPNPLNVKSHGVLPVAILGSEDFDVNTIVVTSVRLAGVAPIRDSYEDVAAPVSNGNECECSTEGPDGFPDLTLKFETQKIVEAIGEVDHGDELVLELTGVLSDETPIEGSDCVVIRGRYKPLNRADFNGNGIVDMADFAAFAENWLESSIVEN